MGYEKSRGVVPGFFRGEEDPDPHVLVSGTAVRDA